MNRRIDLKTEIVSLGWSVKGLSEATGIFYMRLIKILNGYQGFAPEEEKRVREAFEKRKADIKHKR